MSYVNPDFRSAKALREALELCICGHDMYLHDDGVGACIDKVPSGTYCECLLADHGVTVYEPGLGTVPTDGPVYLEGPHHPKAHTWYAEGRMEKGKLVKIKK